MTTCAMISLGCPKNLVDGEQMLGLLEQHRLKIIPDVERAEVVIINTCGFLNASREESLANIRMMEELRTEPSHPLKALLVTGCLVSRDREALVAACPGVDAFLDIYSREEIGRVAQNILNGNAVKTGNELPLYLGQPGCVPRDEHRYALLPPHVAYLKIAEGCNRRCAFCTIPLIRGPYISKPPEEILAEARRLADSGVKELIIIAQDTTLYGRDLENPDATLAKLLSQLAEIPEIRWIRVMYLYPQSFGDDLVEAFATVPKILPYIDIPLQHINDRVLTSMRRAATRSMTVELLEKLVSRIPGLAVRTAFIVGYPGETQAEFDELLAFIRKRKFQRLGVFEYSAEEGTPAAAMPQQVPEKTKRKRLEAVMKAQQRISAEWLRSLRGQKIEVILDLAAESATPAGKGTWIGRSVYDAPEVDGCVYVTGENLRVGDIITCEIIDSDEYDLYAAAIPEDSKEK